MASEAIATGVPIIFPESYIGSDHSASKKYMLKQGYFEETPDPEYYTARYYDAAHGRYYSSQLQIIGNKYQAADFQQMLMSFRTTTLKKFSNIIFGK